MTDTQTRLLFYSAAVFNWAAVLILALLAQPLGLQPPPLQSLFGQIALSAIFVFGCGYWMVGRAPGPNRGIVVIGAVGKLSVVAIVVSHWFVGSATPQMAALASGDLVYTFLFLLFLKHSAPEHVAQELR
jgi:hypothetical protein